MVVLDFMVAAAAAALLNIGLLGGVITTYTEYAINKVLFYHRPCSGCFTVYSTKYSHCNLLV